MRIGSGAELGVRCNSQRAWPPASITFGAQKRSETGFWIGEAGLLTAAFSTELVFAVLGRTVIDAVIELPSNDAVMVTSCLVETIPALTLKLAALEPAVTVTDGGIVSSLLFSISATVEPPVGAASDKPTLQVVAPPEASAVDEHWNLVRVSAGVIVREAVAELPFSDAVTVTA